ncbi:MAG: transposase [Thermotogota bacterium]
MDKCGKHIPFVSKAFDHCTNQFKNAQTILTIGEVLDGVFCPNSILFATSKTKAKAITKKSQQTSKNDMLVNWLKENKGTHQVLIGDSWYTNSYIIEACQNWFEVPFIGQLKKNQKVKIGNQVMTIQALIASAKLNRSAQVNDKRIRYRSYEAFVQAIRNPVKIVVTELENGTQTVLIASDTTLAGEEIILYYAQRWSIEVFFKLAKQHLGLGDCHLRSAAGHRHYMVLVSIAYLIFNDLKAFLQKQGQDNRNKAVLDFIRLSLSQLLVTYCVEVRFSFALLNSDPTPFLCRSPGLLQESLHSCTS